ncbi:hypothetical protein DFH07DRAFT_1038067 [Mycena maculata]|uniref:Uncharacterized protein n=1 Tax=Mycena maculata TaxID=230809 RepID=A0AAD7N5G8_9AGAR|nr:hypothetical protein DFH07DRAFT_1038067 [Mycena maculata]
MAATNEEMSTELSKALKTLFSVGDFSEPSEANIDKIFSFVAPCIGKDHSTMKQIWQRRSGDNIRLIADLKKATFDDGGHDYSFFISQFSNSINPLTSSQADAFISSYLDEIRPGFKDLLERAEPLKLWVPDKALPHSDFLARLRIPASSQGGPDMLVHDLGNFKRNEGLQKLVEKLFQTYISGKSCPSTILLNTSGSGKTRTVLEALCQVWGFYFTCHVDTEGRGSIDLQRTISERIADDPCFQPDLPTTDFSRVNDVNSKIAQNRFKELLLARLLILEFFCEMARETSRKDSLTDDHKKLWAFLQIRPSCIGQDYGDIFNTLTERIMGITSAYRNKLIDQKIRALAAMNTNQRPLFCVVDEAQVAATLLPCAFVTSDPAGDTRRPSLRELARAFVFEDLPISLNLTGTAIDRNIVLGVMTSGIFKGPPATTITHFGAFDVAKEQIAYMIQFLPKELTETIPVRKLFERVSYWLKGRYRFTAAYMKDLLSTGFQKPHRMLNEFIRLSTIVPIPGSVALRWSTGFRPTDCQEFWEPGDVVPSELMRFTFDKLKKDRSLEEVIRIHTAKFWMRSEIDGMIADQRHFDLIHHGFARYAGNDVGDQSQAKVTLDEPLVLLALGEWLQVCDLPLAEQLRMEAARAVTEGNGANGLEEYIALYLSAVFNDQTPLTDIFRFHKYIDPPDWAKKPAALVSLYTEDDIEKDGDRVVIAEGRVQHHMRPSVTIGKDASTIEATKEWLRHTDRAPICFPDKFVGPDLLFILRLQDEKKSLIWVALQSKFSGANVLEAKTIQAAVSTVTPQAFHGFRHKAVVLVGPKKTKDEVKKDAAEQQRKDQHKKDVLHLLDLLPRRLRTPQNPKRKPIDAREKIIRRLTAEDEEKAQKAKEEEKWADWVDAWGTKNPGKPIPKPRRTARKLKKSDVAPLGEDAVELTADEKEILQGAGEYSVLRVVVGWPAETSLHDRAVELPGIYFDEENHPVVELNIEHWANTMARLHASAGNYIADVWKGRGQT